MILLGGSIVRESLFTKNIEAIININPAYDCASKLESTAPYKTPIPIIYVRSTPGDLTVNDFQTILSMLPQPLAEETAVEIMSVNSAYYLSEADFIATHALALRISQNIRYHFIHHQYKEVDAQSMSSVHMNSEMEVGNFQISHNQRGDSDQYFHTAHYAFDTGSKTGEVDF